MRCLALLLLPLLVACGRSDRACLRKTQPPCDVLDPTCQEVYTKAAACLLDQPDHEPLAFRTISSEEYEAEVRAEYESEEYQAYLDILEDWGRALALLGLADPDTSAVDATFEINTGTVPAFYDLGTQQITILEDYTGDRDYARSTFLHEATHALQDQREGLLDWFGTWTEDSETQLAARTVVEGEANLTGIRLAAVLYDISLYEGEGFAWDAYFADRQQLAYESVADSDDPFFLTGRYFPYVFGEEHLLEAFRDAGQPSIPPVFDDPPRATAAFLFRHGAGATGELASQADLAPPVEGYGLFDEDVLGAWHVGVLARVHGGSETFPQNPVRGWRDDLMSTWRTDDEVATVWRIACADAAAAEAIAEFVDRDTVALAVDGDTVVVAASTVEGDATTWLDWALQDDPPQARRARALQPVAKPPPRRLHAVP